MRQAISDIMSGNEPKEVKEALADPYFKILEEVYSEEMPLATLMDKAELTIRSEGESFSLSSILGTELKNMIGNAVTALRNIVSVIADGMHGDCDYVAMLAPGSVCIGLAIPEHDGELLGDEDPIRRSMIEAAEVFETVCDDLSHEDFEDRLRKHIPNDRLRRTALNSVKSIIPHRGSRIRMVEICGRNKRSLISPEKALQVKEMIKKSIGTGIVTVQGVVREINLNSHSVHICQISGQPYEKISAVYDRSIPDEDVLRWANRQMLFHGTLTTKDEKPCRMVIEFAEEAE